MPSLKKFENLLIKYSTIGILTVILLISSFAVYKTIPNDTGEMLSQYDEKMKEFAGTEAMALEVFSRPENTPQEKILSEIQDRGIYYWNDNLKLIESMNDWNLPQPLKEQNAKLKEYCELRIKSYELMYKAISENTDKYAAEINDYNNKIETIIKELTEKNKK